VGAHAARRRARHAREQSILCVLVARPSESCLHAKCGARSTALRTSSSHARDGSHASDMSSDDTLKGHFAQQATDACVLKEDSSYKTARSSRWFDVHARGMEADQYRTVRGSLVVHHSVCFRFGVARHHDGDCAPEQLRVYTSVRPDAVDVSLVRSMWLNVNRARLCVCVHSTRA
jgi:hypothetical protein